MIKAIIFDCFGVLTIDSWRAFVDSLPEAIVSEARSITHAYDSGIITKQALVEQVSGLSGIDQDIVRLEASPKLAKNQELFNYIRDLKQKKYKIGILSNVSDDWITRVLLTEQEVELFDAMVFSYQIGTAKPDHKIFKIALNRLGIEPTEAIFVDDVDRYCQAAEALGMQTILYKDFQQVMVNFNKLLEV